MPNWCSNSVTIQHDNPEMVDRIVRGYTGEGLFGEFIPCPPELYQTDAWYMWCVNHWGTKWDVSNNLENSWTQLTRTEPGTVKLVFESAWSPPLPFYEHLESLGFKVQAMYYEPGMCFCGVYQDGMDDDYDLSSMDSDDVAQTIPQELDEEFNISQSMADWEAEQEEGV